MLLESILTTTKIMRRESKTEEGHEQSFFPTVGTMNMKDRGSDGERGMMQ